MVGHQFSLRCCYIDSLNELIWKFIKAFASASISIRNIGGKTYQQDCGKIFPSARLSPSPRFHYKVIRAKSYKYASRLPVQCWALSWWWWALLLLHGLSLMTGDRKLLNDRSMRKLWLLTLHTLSPPLTAYQQQEQPKWQQQHKSRNNIIAPQPTQTNNINNTQKRSKIIRKNPVLTISRRTLLSTLYACIPLEAACHEPSY